MCQRDSVGHVDFVVVMPSPPSPHSPTHSAAATSSSAASTSGTLAEGARGWFPCCVLSCDVTSRVSSRRVVSPDVVSHLAKASFRDECAMLKKECVANADAAHFCRG